MSSNKMREEFEAWARSELMSISVNYSGKYIFSATSAAWQAWQASRADLVVKMPVSYSPQFQDSWVMDQEDIENALKDAGVSYE